MGGADPVKLVLFVFAGREANLAIQRPFIDRILDQHPGAELHLWDLTRTPEDAEYVRAQASDRIKVLTHLHPGHPVKCRAGEMDPRTGRPARRGCTCVIHRPPYEKPYAWYSRKREYADAVFVKLDDDVLFLETNRFDDLLAPLTEHPNAVVSANVGNNAVCAKHDPGLQPLVTRKFKPGKVSDPAADRRWWRLHISADFARLCHEQFLKEWRWLTVDREPAYTRSRPGERMSINCIAFTHPTMKRLATMVREDRLGDEGAVDRLLPRIATSFRVAHLTFGPQDKAMTLAELNDLRARYAALGKEYLGA